MVNKLKWADFEKAYLGTIQNVDGSASFAFDSDLCTQITKEVAFQNNDKLIQISDLQKYADHFDDFYANNPTINGYGVTIIERDTPSFLAAVA